MALRIASVILLAVATLCPAKLLGRGVLQNKQTGSLCVEGKLVPRLYVVGAQKAVTTTMFADLKQLGAINMHLHEEDVEEKEFHFFDNWVGLAQHVQANKVERLQWLSLMPPCPEAGTAPQLLFDATPCDMRMVRLPDGTRPTGSHWGRWFLTHDEDTRKYAMGDEMDLPKKLTKFYGDESSKLVFAAMLREPLSRMQSAWYHSSQAYANWEQCRDCKAASFAEAVEATLNRAETNHTYDDWLWGSMYADHLKAWLSKFQPSQIVVMPYKLYTHGDKVSVCSDLAQRLDWQFDCNALNVAGEQPKEFNAHSHLSLEEDMPPELRDRFQNYIAGHNADLVHVLAEAQKNGAGLANYHGSTGDEAAIQKWLVENW